MNTLYLHHFPRFHVSLHRVVEHRTGETVHQQSTCGGQNRVFPCQNIQRISGGYLWWFARMIRLDDDVIYGFCLLILFSISHTYRVPCIKLSM